MGTGNMFKNQFHLHHKMNSLTHKINSRGRAVISSEGVTKATNKVPDSILQSVSSSCSSRGSQAAQEGENANGRAFTPKETKSKAHSFADSSLLSRS